LNRLNSPLRIIFAGTPEFSLAPLQALIDGDYDLVAVLTQPDRPAGRGKRLRASPVKQLALENHLQVLQPASLSDTKWQQTIADLEPDLIVVVAYGLMIPEALLSHPALGCWNIHASLLPRWRGAAPIHRAIEAGDAQTGVCIMQMEASLDTGPVYFCIKTDISDQDTTGILHDRLAIMGASALQHCLDLASKGELPLPQKQDESAVVYAHKLSKAEAELDWSQPAVVLQRKIRAFNPWPVAWCEWNGQRVRIWQAEVVACQGECVKGQLLASQIPDMVMGTSDNALKVLEIQRAGGQRMPAVDFLNAQRGK